MTGGSSRIRGGVQATQRLLEVEQNGTKVKDIEPPVTYKPYAGAGAGIRLGRMDQRRLDARAFPFPRRRGLHRVRESSAIVTVAARSKRYPYYGCLPNRSAKSRPSFANSRQHVNVHQIAAIISVTPTLNAFRHKSAGHGGPPARQIMR